MIDGIILGVITWISLLFSFSHLPSKVKFFLFKNPVLTDAIAVFICFFFLSGISKSIVSVIGSMICGLLVNLTQLLRKKYYDNTETNI